MGKHFNRSVASFPNEYMKIWEQAVNEEFEIKAPYNKAVALRHRLYTLRSAMRREHHPLLSFAEKVVIRISDPDAEDIVIMTFTQADKDLLPFLHKAGIIPPPLTSEEADMLQRQAEHTGADVIKSILEREDV